MTETRSDPAKQSDTVRGLQLTGRRRMSWLVVGVAGLTVVFSTQIRRWAFRRARTPIPVTTNHTVTQLLWQPPLLTHSNVTAISVTNKTRHSSILFNDYASHWRVTIALVLTNLLTGLIHLDWVIQYYNDNKYKSNVATATKDREIEWPNMA